jgi:hypothetical protein
MLSYPHGSLTLRFTSGKKHPGNLPRMPGDDTPPWTHRTTTLAGRGGVFLDGSKADRREP